MFVIIFLICCINSFADSSFTKKNQIYDIDKAHQYFEDFIRTYNRQYLDDQEKQRRYKIFKERLALINEMNTNRRGPVFGITKFADLTSKEFFGTHTGFYDDGKDTNGTQCKIIAEKDIPSNKLPLALDWRDKNAITSVKYQDKCGSCWAFTAISSVEAQYAIKYGELLDLSEQQLLDCDKRNHACRGGYMSKAFRSLIDMGGSMLEKDYPYIAKKNKTCNLKKNKFKVKLSGCMIFDIYNEDTFKQILYHYGPVTVVVASNDLQDYVGGVLYLCDQPKLDHTALLIGYGQENGVPYWIFKNSFGDDWGENGFFRVLRNADSCGMLNPYISAAIVS